MTQDEIIRMAREAGAWLDGADPSLPMWVIKKEELESFAAIIAAHEREACAKVCDEHGFYGAAPARDIRVRGNNK